MLARSFGAAGATAIAVGLFAGAPAAAQSAEVLAPAREGRLQCFEPNVAQKTCQSIGGYTFNADGAIDNAADVLTMPSPVIIMRVNSPVTVRDNAICGPLTAADIDRATFTIDGAPANEQDTSDIRAAMTEQLGPMLNVELCMTLTPVDGGFRADTRVGGIERPDQVQRVIWVRPEEGYRVAP
ncbi:MAG: hypothetical protein ACT4OF_00760 [Caulobacteraceae bacterium]